MAQAQRITGDGAVKFVAAGAPPIEHQRFVAAKRPQPVASRRTSSGDAEVGQEVIDAAAAGNINAGRDGRCLHEMEVAVDKAGGDCATPQPDHPGLLADQRFQIGEAPVGDNQIGGNSDGIAVRMTENVTTV